MGWSTAYFIIGIVAGILGIWNLARHRNLFLSLTGILWFFIMLFRSYIPQVSRFVIIAGIPDVGTLLLYVLVPVFLILAFFTGGRR
jgi:hypothetical protein